MNGPTRLRESGGLNGRLLGSARLDQPSRASRERALAMTATIATFAATAGAGVPTKTAGASGLYKTVATWICVGAVGGAAAALVTSELLEPVAAPRASAERPALTPLLTPESPASPPAAAPRAPDPYEIAAEPASPAVVASVPEAKQLDGVRAAIARRDPSSALAALDAYDAQHPSGALQAESAALRVQAVSASGDVAGAQRLAYEFEKRYPKHPLTGAVRASAQVK